MRWAGLGLFPRAEGGWTVMTADQSQTQHSARPAESIQPPPSRLRITVMRGGPSAEREISLRSGASVATALRSLGHTVDELDPQTPDWTLPAGTDVVFLALHGTYGEDGAIQQQLEHLGVPYTGCGPEASRVAFDKVLTKEHCFKAGVPTAPYLIFDTPSAPWPKSWTPPLVIKPVCQGSSVGLQFVKEMDEWQPALAAALRHDSRVLVEELIVGRETTVGVLEGQPLPVVEVRPKKGRYRLGKQIHAGRHRVSLSGALR